MSKLILWVFPLYFPKVANEHIAKVCVITIIVSYVGGEQSRTSMKATSCHPLLLIDLQEKTILAIM